MRRRGRPWMLKIKGPFQLHLDAPNPASTFFFSTNSPAPVLKFIMWWHIYFFFMLVKLLACFWYEKLTPSHFYHSSSRPFFFLKRYKKLLLGWFFLSRDKSLLRENEILLKTISFAKFVHPKKTHLKKNKRKSTSTGVEKSKMIIKQKLELMK